MSIDVKPKNYVNGSGFIVVFFAAASHIFLPYFLSWTKRRDPLRRSISYYYDDVKKKSESELKGKYFL